MPRSRTTLAGASESAPTTSGSVGSWCRLPSPNVMWPEAYCLCPVHPCVHPCVRLKTLLTQHLAEYLTHFHQTYINDALWDRDECIEYFGSKGHSSRSWWNNIMLEPSLHMWRHAVLDVSCWVGVSTLMLSKGVCVTFKILLTTWCWIPSFVQQWSVCSLLSKLQPPFLTVLNAIVCRTVWIRTLWISQYCVWIINVSK